MITHLIVDVDGTLTDSGIYYDNNGNEIKKFSSKDGLGLKVAKAAGIKLIVLTGRESIAVIQRMNELNVDILVQNVKNKAEWLVKFMDENNLNKTRIGYIGDDLNDLSAMRLCGVIGCPADACKEVKSNADYISTIAGGHGAVRDCIEQFLSVDGTWEKIIEDACLLTAI